MKLPSNRKFGFFFGLILLSISIILHFQNFYFYSLIIFSISCMLFILSFLAPEILSGPNKIWMKFGLMLGKIFNPIILAPKLNKKTLLIHLQSGKWGGNYKELSVKSIIKLLTKLNYKNK